MKYEICIIKADKVLGTKKFHFKKDANKWMNQNILICSANGMSFSLHRI